MESIEVVISIILQFSGIFGMYYLVRAIFMFRRKKFPTPGFEDVCRIRRTYPKQPEIPKPQKQYLVITGFHASGIPGV